MKTINFFFLLSLLIFAICDDEFPKGKDVIVLTDSNYDEIVEKYEYLLILFYGPGCEQCKKFYSEYEKTAQTLVKDNLYLSAVDISKEKNLSEKFQITELPAVKLLSKKNIVDYTGGIKKEEIINWMIKKTIGTAVKILKSVEDVEKFKTENNIVLIYFGTNINDTETFTKEARKNEDIPFGIVESKDIIDKYAKEGTLFLIKKADDLKIELTEINEKMIDELINKYSLPKVFDFSEKTAQIIFGKAIPSLFLFGNKKLLDRWGDYEKLINYLSRTVDTKLKLILANVKDSISKKLAEYIGLKEVDIPSIIIIDPRSGFKKYKMEGEVNDVNTIKFIADWESDNLSQYLRTAPEPKDNNGPVLILVGSTYEKQVLKNDKDVMVLFHFPSCNFCEELIPKYEEVAKLLKEKNPNLLLASFDVNENEIELVNINQFPALKFYPGKNKDLYPIEYLGKREVNDIIEFIKKHADHPIVYEEVKKEEKEEPKKGEEKEEKEEPKKEEEKEEKKNEEKKDKTGEL